MSPMQKTVLKNKKIIITGGSGFVGSALLEFLLKTNTICVIDNEYRGSNLSILEKKYPKIFSKNVVLEKLDIRDSNQLQDVFQQFKPEVVFHLAGIAGVKTVLENPLEVIDVNLNGSYNIAKVVTESKSVKKVVYSSTSEVYGPSTFKSEESTFTIQGPANEARWSYATSKLIGEHIFLAMNREYKIPVAIGRLFNIYGPRQIGAGAIHKFVKNTLSNRPIKIFGDGSQIRAWCYIADCVNGLRIIAEKGNGIYNIGYPDEALTTISLANLVLDLIPSKSKKIFKEMRTSDIRVRVPNIDKIAKLGYKPKVTLRQGLLETIKWYKGQQNKVK